MVYEAYEKQGCTSNICVKSANKVNLAIHGRSILQFMAYKSEFKQGFIVPFWVHHIQLVRNEGNFGIYVRLLILYIRAAKF